MKWGGRGKCPFTHETKRGPKVKDHVFTLLPASIKRIFHLNPDPSKLPPSTSATKARKLRLNKYDHPSKIKKTNQYYSTIYSNPQILYYVLVKTIYLSGFSKETTNDTLLPILHYIMRATLLTLLNSYSKTRKKSVIWPEPSLTLPKPPYTHLQIRPHLS